MKREASSCLSWRGTPLAFLLTGFLWLVLSFVLGVALLVGSVYGTPLPQWLKPLHVHGALVGGILQLAIGGLLVSVARGSDRAYAQTRTALFLTYNAGTAGLLIGLALGNMTIAGLAGMVLMAVVLSLSKTAWIHLGKAARTGAISRIAMAALVSGLAAGIAMAFGLTNGYYAHGRLAHIHLIVLGAMTLTCIVVVNQLIPVMFRTPQTAAPMPAYVLWTFPAGFAVLLWAFLTSAVWLQMVVGFVLLASVVLCNSQLIACWAKAGSPGTAATDHLLIGAVFLLFTIATGFAMAANYAQNPPFLPMGSLHLTAYTHLAFIGFFTQLICGGLSFFVPELLAAVRVQHPPKREDYRARLDAVMNRWRAVQLAGMSLGTMALPLLASLTWSMPLSAVYVQTTVWIAAGLLVASLTLFAAKLAWAVGLRPS